MDILLIALLIIMNGIFAMSEIALISSRKTRLQHWAEEGRSGAKAALKLANEPSHFLSTVQVGITLIGVMNGALGESAIADRMKNYLDDIPELAEFSKPLSLACMVLIITYFSLIVGELVPKRLAMRNPEPLASALARPMRALSIITFPLVKLLSFSTELALKLFGNRKSKEPSITEEEIHVLLEQGTEEGVIDHAEHELVSNIFRLDDKTVASVMTPRMDIFFLDIDEPFEQNRSKLIKSPYSRFPLCQGGFDQILGIVQAKDMLNSQLRSELIDLPALVKPPLYVLPNITLMHLLEEFKKTRMHFALVIDEYGELLGLLTLNDVMEAIVGDIASADLEEEPLLAQREDGSWLIDGKMPVDQFKNLFHLDELPDEGKGNYHTVGGFVMVHIGKVPTAADHFHWKDLRIEVVDMDKNRVDKILVSQNAP
ncbi:MAG: hemolysin family protein [Methylococcaceae bacterium]|nr:hemolysin family protein [Methylococcaceae bacterium]